MVVTTRLKGALKLVGPKKPAAQGYKAIQILIWELMSMQSNMSKLSTSVNRMQVAMDKKMHKITEAMKKAEGDVKKGKSKAAVQVLKSAEKKNEKLVKEDKNVRDPMIKKCKQAAVKLPKNFGKVK